MGWGNTITRIFFVPRTFLSLASTYREVLFSFRSIIHIRVQMEHLKTSVMVKISRSTHCLGRDQALLFCTVTMMIFRLPILLDQKQENTN